MHAQEGLNEFEVGTLHVADDTLMQLLELRKDLAAWLQALTQPIDIVLTHACANDVSEDLLAPREQTDVLVLSDVEEHTEARVEGCLLEQSLDSLCKGLIGFGYTSE